MTEEYGSWVLKITSSTPFLVTTIISIVLLLIGLGRSVRSKERENDTGHKDDRNLSQPQGKRMMEVAEHSESDDDDDDDIDGDGGVGGDALIMLMGFSCLKAEALTRKITACGPVPMEPTGKVTQVSRVMSGKKNTLHYSGIEDAIWPPELLVPAW